MYLAMLCAVFQSILLLWKPMPVEVSDTPPHYTIATDL